MQVNTAEAIVIGAGPAGLMAAEQLAGAGVAVQVFEAMPSVARKFLRAGIGGLNITHNENESVFRQRFGAREGAVGRWLDAFGPGALRAWCADLGVETFVGSSSRVFPVEKKAAPLLRKWLRRLRAQGVQIHVRHRWLGWSEDGGLRIQSLEGEQRWQAPVVIFALGGGSWKKLGSDGSWLSLFSNAGVACAPLLPANCGFEYPWPEDIATQHAGSALKNIALEVQDDNGETWRRKGDAMLSHYGLEGSLVYAASSLIRDRIRQDGACQIHWDLLPDSSVEQLTERWSRRKPKDSLSNALRKQCGLSGSKLALLKALSSREEMANQQALPALLKHLPQTLSQIRPIDEAISTAGGICLEAVNERLMLKSMPGTFCVGEMLDWEAPTGGYLLTACFASGLVAGRGAVALLSKS